MSRARARDRSRGVGVGIRVGVGIGVEGIELLVGVVIVDDPLTTHIGP